MRYLDSSSVALSCPRCAVLNLQSNPGLSMINPLSRLPKSLCTWLARPIHLRLIIQEEIPFGGRIKAPALFMSFANPIIFGLPLSARGRVKLSTESFCPASSRTWNNLANRELRQPGPCTRMTADLGARPLDRSWGWSLATESSSDSSEDIHSNWNAPSNPGCE